MSEYTPIDMQRKKSDILVVHCSDPRFQQAYRQVIDELGKFYDLIAFPGASKAIAEQPLVVENIKLLHDLHHFEGVRVYDHVECGGFGEVDDELAAHTASMVEADKKIRQNVGQLAFSGHLLTETGVVDIKL